MHVFHSPARGRKRVTLVLEVLTTSTAFETAATAPILAILLAQRCKADLRIVTRAAPAQPQALRSLLHAVDADLQGQTQLRFLPIGDDKCELDLMEGERLIVDQWSNALAVLAAVEPGRLLYVLQADERLAAANEEARQRCDALLRRRDLHCLVRSAALAQQVVRSEPDRLLTQAWVFEPPVEAGASEASEIARRWQAALEPVLAWLAGRC